MKLPFLNCELEVGSKYLTTELRDSNDILGDAEALHARMEDDGCLLIRGLHDKAQVLATRQRILEKLAERGMLAPNVSLMEGVYNPEFDGTKTTGSMGNKELTKLPEFRQVVEGERVMSFFKHFLGGDVLTFDFKWLRTAGTGAGSPIHCDIVFMGRGTQNLYSCWTPIGDVTLDMGPLVLCLGSHNFEKVRQTYGASDVDRDLIEGKFSDDPIEIVDKFGGIWATTEFQAGDAIIFNMFNMHASLVNTSKRVRISADTRYQLAWAPVDERWIGETPIGHYAWKKPDVEIEPFEKSRARWGV